MERSRSRPFCGDVSSGLLVFCPTSIAWIADCEDVSSGAMASAPLRGAARGVFTVPFAAVLWRCLE
eukprot:3765024-Pyramimonas_sp.AAC.1